MAATSFPPLCPRLGTGKSPLECLSGRFFLDGAAALFGGGLLPAGRASPGLGGSKKQSREGGKAGGPPPLTPRGPRRGVWQERFDLDVPCVCRAARRRAWRVHLPAKINRASVWWLGNCFHGSGGGREVRELSRHARNSVTPAGRGFFPSLLNNSRVIHQPWPGTASLPEGLQGSSKLLLLRATTTEPCQLPAPELSPISLPWGAEEEHAHAGYGAVLSRNPKSRCRRRARGFPLPGSQATQREARGHRSNPRGNAGFGAGMGQIQQFGIRAELAGDGAAGAPTVVPGANPIPGAELVL